ncbi:MAG: PEGA domain-containing protein [Polyangiaceae bacterium]
MNCPDIVDLLASPRRAGIDEHIACCDACGGVVGLAEVREQIAEHSPDACVRAEILIAEREVGALSPDDKAELQAHLEECATCNELAVRLASLPPLVREVTSVDARTGVHALPEPRADGRPPALWWIAAASFGLLTGLLGLTLGLWVNFWGEPAAPQAATPIAPATPTDSRPGSAVPSKGKAPGNTVSPALNPFAAPSATAGDGKGFLTLVCSPSCDKVVAAGRNLGPSPIVRRALPTGSQEIVLHHGTVKKTIEVTIVENQTTARRVVMSDSDALDDDKKEQFGTLNVNCVPACNRVYVGPSSLGATPVLNHKLATGRHIVILLRNGEIANRVVNITAGKTTTVAHRWNTSCIPPYTIDKNGVKHAKPECADTPPGPPTVDPKIFDPKGVDPGNRTHLKAFKDGLKAKVLSGRASESEKRMLRALCRQLGDASCINAR